jgi:hypothetical protein
MGEKQFIKGSEVVASIARTTLLDNYSDIIPATLAPDIQAVIETNPFLTKPCIFYSVLVTATGYSTILTTSTSKDTYLLGAFLGYDADVTADNIAVSLLLTPALAPTGLSAGEIPFIQFDKPSVTIRTDFKFITPPRPLLLKCGTLVRSGTAFTAGSCKRNIGIFYVEIDSTPYNLKNVPSKTYA